MQKIRWPELDILECSGKIVDEFWEQTNAGPISRGYLFNISELDKLTDLKNRIAAKKKELSDIEAEIYRIKR